jgi:hypothetical protein
VGWGRGEKWYSQSWTPLFPASVSLFLEAAGFLSISREWSKILNSGRVPNQKERKKEAISLQEIVE